MKLAISLLCISITRLSIIIDSLMLQISFKYNLYIYVDIYNLNSINYPTLLLILHIQILVSLGKHLRTHLKHLTRYDPGLSGDVCQDK